MKKIIRLFIILFLLTLAAYFTQVAEVYAADPVVAGAGDISCARFGSSGGSSCQQMATSDLLLWINPTAVFTLGDNQYPDGALSDFNNYFDPSWGRLKSKIFPSVGNHEYHITGAQGYFDYFNGVGQNSGRAGERGKGYYSYDIGAWHIIALNSQISMSQGSPQETWLRNDLAAHSNVCTMAYMHRPRFSSSAVHGSSSAVAPLFKALYDYEADLILAGHDHLYERFAPQSPSGAYEPTRGVRQFVAGSGGSRLYSFGTPLPNSEFRNSTDYGVLKLTLHPTSYSWEFVKADSNHTVIDSGTANCVGGGTVVTATPTQEPQSTATPTQTPQSTNTPTPTSTRDPGPTTCDEAGGSCIQTTPGNCGINAQDAGQLDCATNERCCVLFSQNSPTPTPSQDASPTPTPDQTCPTGSQGDADCDGDVDGVDFVIFDNNYGNDVSGGPTDGDFNGDGTVDGVDFVRLYNNYGLGIDQPTNTPSPGQSSPTPTGTTTGALRVPQDYASIEAAYDAASHGDTILVAPGTYSVCLSGNRTKRVIIKAENPATTSSASQRSILNSSCSHVIQFRTPLDDDGVFNPGEVVEFNGFVLNDSDDGFSYESASGTVINNIINSQGDDSVDVDGASEAHVVGNILQNDGNDGIENRLHGFSSSRVIRIIYRNNVIYNANNDGIQLIEQTSSTTPRKYLIANNLIIGNGDVGIGASPDTGQNPEGYPFNELIYVINNTIVDNQMGGLLGGANMRVYNNIFYNNKVAAVKNVSGSSSASHNLFFGNDANYVNSNNQGSNVFADPQFINTSLPPSFTSFQLSSGSSAIDAGRDVASIYSEFDVTPPAVSGSAPDLGWLEFGI